MLVGAYSALMHTDLKRVLAYSTVSALGMLTLMLGIGSPSAIRAAMVLLLAHALYKGALFLVVGAVDHETGARDSELLGGLFRAMPITACAAALAGLSNAGAPPLLGFVGKELVYEAVFEAPMAHILAGAVFLANISFVAVAAIVGIRPFIGRTRQAPKTLHEAPFALWAGPMLLAAMGLIIGLQPHIIAGPLISPAVTAVEGQKGAVELSLWHGLNPTLAWSAAGLVLGAGLFVVRRRLRQLMYKVDYSAMLGPARWYEFALKGLNTLAIVQTRILQNGRLHFYLLIVITTTVILVGATLSKKDILVGLSRWGDIRAYEALLALMILSATILVVRSRSRMTAVVALGVVGYGVALLFLLFSAPDLAMTQFAIETLSVILLVLVLFRLPTYKRYSRRMESMRDVVPAIAAGGLMTALVLIATTLTGDSHLTPYFVQNSLSLAKGRNIVNVILVDFRGLDTLGEITVLSVAAIGVYSLLKLRSKDRGE
jgi:multicomponent Na+:H+ antiporter subunit A